MLPKIEDYGQFIGKEHVRKNFLITRHLYDYMKIIEYYTRNIADDVLGTARYLKRLILK
ncbi:MAG: hypothetical protein AABX78_00440 [Nanoarchaeota archaeon]